MTGILQIQFLSQKISVSCKDHGCAKIDNLALYEFLITSQIPLKKKVSKSVDTIFWDSKNIQLFGIEDVQGLRANLWDFCQFGVWFVCPEPLISSHFWAPAQSPPWSHVNLLHPWHPLARSSLDLLFVCVSLFSAWPFSLTSQEKKNMTVPISTDCLQNSSSAPGTKGWSLWGTFNVWSLRITVQSLKMWKAWKAPQQP